MNTHTPGPWTIHGETVQSDAGGGAFRRFRIVTANPAWLDQEMVCQLSDYPTAKGEANARLIAAAPDLLEAARWALAILDGYRNHEPVEMCAVAENADALRAAIATAEGES